MPPRPPLEEELYDAWITQYIKQHHVDIQRLWRRVPPFAQPYIGVGPHAVDPFLTTTTVTCDPDLLRPDVDVSIGDWTDEGGATTDLWESINEVSASDSDYIKTPTNNDSYRCEVTDAGATRTGQVRLRFRWQFTGTTVPVNEEVRVFWFLYVNDLFQNEGNTTAKDTEDVWFDEEFNLGERTYTHDAIELRFDVKQSWDPGLGPGPTDPFSEARISWVELEYPC